MPLEPVNREIGRRTDVVGIFPTSADLTRREIEVFVPDEEFLATLVQAAGYAANPVRDPISRRPSVCVPYSGDRDAILLTPSTRRTVPSPWTDRDYAPSVSSSACA